MGIEEFLFFVFAAILVFAGLMVVTVRSPVFAVLFLVLAFFTSAGLWLMLEAEFLAITLVLVYVGAVMVLFMFVVMMLDINLVPLKEGFIKYLPVGVLVGVVIAIEIGLVVGAKNFGLDKVVDPVGHEAGYSNTKELGRVLYTEYMYPFEIASVILLVAIIAAISVTLRKGRQTKYVKPEQQVSVHKEDRLRIVKMDAVKKQSAAEEE